MKTQPTDTSQPARIAERLRDNEYGDFPRWSAAATPAIAPDDTYPYVAEYAFGWPERALLFDVRYNHDTKATKANDAVPLHLIDRLTGRSSLRAGDETLYPTRPILNGFLVNMLVLGVLADRALVWFMLPPCRWITRCARRRQHERRFDAGLCPKCRYPLNGSTGASCPECGAPGNPTAPQEARPPVCREGRD